MTDKMRSEFEEKFPPSEYIEWCGGTNRYQALVMNSEDLDNAASQNKAFAAWQACAARMVPLHAEQIRVAAVAAIREVTGCPDIKGKDGAYLVDALIVNLLEPEAQEPKK